MAEKRQMEYRPLADLRAYERNARKHPAAQIQQLVAAIKEWGFTNPILVTPDGEIIAGHGRFEAARLLGLAEVPVIALSGLSEARRRALVLADNRIAEGSGWDNAMLALELGDLQAAGMDMGLVGFSDRDLSSILGGGSKGGLTDPDAVPAAPAVPASQPGDLWQCGPHRVICGDATSKATVEALLAGVRPHLMVTDPPYGVEYDANWRNEAARNCDGMGNRALGAGAVGVVLNDDRADWREAWELFPGDVLYCWHAGKYAGEVQASLEAAGFEVRCQVIWAKPRFAISRGHYHWQHEPCWYAVRKGKTAHWSGDRKQSTLWEIAHNKSETGHSTQKPVECMRRPIENNSSPGQAIYDPFLGSGTTMIAAEQTGRVCYGLELNPAYADIIVKRWQDFTGQKAVRVSDGMEFDNARTKAHTDSAEAGHGEPRTAAA